MLQNKRLIITIPLLLLFTLLLAACGGDTAGEQPEASEPAAAEVEVEAPEEPVDTTGTTDTSDSAEPATEPAVMETFVIVPAESRASYLVDEEFLENALSKLGIEAGQTDVVGSTKTVEGQIQLNTGDLSAPLGENSFMVDLSTLESDQDRRDKWIRENGPNFNRFPTALFTATSLSGLPDSYDEGQEIQFQVSGDLTVHEVTVPVTFDATATLENDTLSGILTTRKLISDWGIEPPAFAQTLTVADEFGIQVEFTAVKQ